MSVVHSKDRRARLTNGATRIAADEDIEHRDCDYPYTERNRDGPAQPCTGQAFDDRNRLGDAFAPLSERVDRNNQSRRVDLSLSDA